MSDPIKGITTNTMGTNERPRDAQNPAPDLSQIRSVTVGTNELIEIEGLDPETMDPEKHYRLVNAKNPAVMRRRVRQGYTIELLKEEGGVRPLITPESPDGTIRFGDRVLMSCPRKLFVERREKLFRFSESRISAAQSSPTVKEKAAAYGITTLDSTEGRSNVQKAEIVQERQT